AQNPQLPRKSKLAPLLEKRLEDILKREKKRAYQTDAWARSIRNRFNAMPEEIKSERKLTERAALLLAYLFIDSLAEFKLQVPLTQARDELNLPLFMILGRAQEEAKSADRSTVDSRSLVASLASWWTSIWPFC